jgi:ribosome recycling factor
MFDIDDLKRRMEGSINAFNNELKGLRTGRASTSLLDPINVDAYGSMTPISQIGSVSTPEARLLTVQVWDTNLVPAVEKAIRTADLGLNPASEGNLIRIPLPELNEERRAELVKVAGKYAENGRVAIRNVRRDGMEALKKEEKNGNISKDEQHDLGETVQKLTDEHIAQIDSSLKAKEEEITTV